jgi:tetratricopeptide (TPR) repeat protein
VGVFVLVLTSASLAQTTQIEGTVKLKDKDGTLKPVEGAIIDIYRTDIKGRWDVKTDKKGRYIRLGMPVQGTFLVVVSGPGIQPTWLVGVRLVSAQPIDFEVFPGDGSRPTQEQIQAQQSQQPRTPAQPQVSAADRAKAEEQRKEQEAQMEAAKEMQASFDQARTRYNQGVELMRANNYTAAMSEFEAAAGVDPSKHEAFVELAYKANANLAETHYQAGVDLFNKKQRDEAKVHFQKAVESINKSLTIAAGVTPDKNPNLNNELITYYSIFAKNALLLIEHFGAVDQVEPMLKNIEKVEALDAANKNKWAVMRGDVFRFAGRSDEAVAAYKNAIAADPNNVDALYGLGLTLIAFQEKEKIQEGANALAEFVSKAPETDRRVPDVKAALEAVKTAYQVEAEKPEKEKTPPRRRRP